VEGGDRWLVVVRPLVHRHAVPRGSVKAVQMPTEGAQRSRMTTGDGT
jgi:hypothetical protein